MRTLFDDIERKNDLIRLLELAKDGDGVRIFIGSENRLFSLSGSSIVAAPYANAQGKIVGVIGVLGPTRLNYGAHHSDGRSHRQGHRAIARIKDTAEHERRTNGTERETASRAELEAAARERAAICATGCCARWPMPRTRAAAPSARSGSLAICHHQFRARHAGHRRQFRPRAGRLPAGIARQPPIRRSRR